MSRARITDRDRLKQIALAATKDELDAHIERLQDIRDIRFPTKAAPKPKRKASAQATLPGTGNENRQGETK